MCYLYYYYTMHSQSDEQKKSLLDDHKMSHRNVIAFFIAGLLNNTSYVIMIAGAKDISPSLVI